MNGTREVARGFVIARSNGLILLESGEEILDQVARFVQMAVTAALVPARGFWGNHHGLACDDATGPGVLGATHLRPQGHEPARA